jgi:tRNA 2-thiocytidine biosynthesis protein TtcA
MNPRKNLRRKLRHLVGKAISDFGMIREGDRVMVCVSGGKDSYGLLRILSDLQRRAPVRFLLSAVHLDQKQPGHSPGVLTAYLHDQGIPFRVIEKDTFAIVRSTLKEGEGVCSLCSRLRRGILYNAAVEQGCNKIALGHHADDIIETLLLNQFYGGVVKTMPAVLRSSDGRNTVIRPLVYCRESDLIAFAEAEHFPIAARGPCGFRQNLKRRRIKELLQELAAEIPEVRGSLLAAAGHVVPSHLLDRGLFDFRALSLRTGAQPPPPEDEPAEPDEPCGENR